MTGGSGIDRFVFSFDGKRDTVTDFEDGIDLIDLDGKKFDDIDSITDQNGGTLITITGTEMFLEGVVLAVTPITEADFILSM